jgi:hypothetical protein
VRVEPVPVLGILRELWSKPRDMARFHEYVAKIKGGPDGGIFAPLVAANPMAKPHMIAYADALAALGADRLLSEAASEAARRLAHSPVETKLSLVPIDDVGGGWSERAMVDFAARFGDGKKRARDYGYTSAMVYASEPPAAPLVRERLLAAVYRRAWWERHGTPRTLREMLRQEANALRFAGAKVPTVTDPTTARRILDPLLDATLHATLFAAMYGDAAAERCGHKQLGLPDNAGFAIALEAACGEEKPEELV